MRRPLTLVIDEQPLFLAALGRLLSCSPLDARVMTATRSDDAIAIAERMPIELVICDVRAEPVGGTELPEKIRGLRPGVHVILLADREDERRLIAALRSGASGFFTKDTGVEEFVEGVEAVLSGQNVVGRNLVHRALVTLGGREEDEPGGMTKLSQAERGVLILIGQAQSIRSIAEVRGISEKTVRNHLANVYRKLGLRNRAEAIIWAIRMGAV
jgi:DNA-binding NarL/FixJ family response regulator